MLKDTEDWKPKDFISYFEDLILNTYNVKTKLSSQENYIVVGNILRKLRIENKPKELLKDFLFNFVKDCKIESMNSMRAIIPVFYEYAGLHKRKQTKNSKRLFDGLGTDLEVWIKSIKDKN